MLVTSYSRCAASAGVSGFFVSTVPAATSMSRWSWLDLAIGRVVRGSGPSAYGGSSASGLPFTRMREYEFQRS